MKDPLERRATLSRSAVPVHPGSTMDRLLRRNRRQEQLR